MSHECIACGAHCVWSASRQKVVCVSCATESRQQPDATAAKSATVELWKALKDTNEREEPVVFARREVQCPTCRSMTTLETNIVARPCESCGTSVFASPDANVHPQPTAVLPFRI